MTRVHEHMAHYYGWRRLRITVVCRCGWVSEHHASRGEAKRAYDGHVWLAGYPMPIGPRRA